MASKKDFSVVELKYFRDEVLRLGESLSDITGAADIESSEEMMGTFEKVHGVFSELSELSKDLGAKDLRNYFEGFCRILNLAIEANNERSTKKVFLMCLDYQGILLRIAIGIHHKDRVRGCLKALEVQSFKQDRLLRGEFFALVGADCLEDDKQRAV